MNISIATQFNVTIEINIRPVTPSYLVIPNTGSPKFLTQLPSSVKVSLGTPFMLKLPKIVDPDPQDRPGLAFIDFGEA